MNSAAPRGPAAGATSARCLRRHDAVRWRVLKFGHRVVVCRRAGESWRAAADTLDSGLPAGCGSGTAGHARPADARHPERVAGPGEVERRLSPAADRGSGAWVAAVRIPGQVGQAFRGDVGH